jgi:trimeric autotransporter adhesin
MKNQVKHLPIALALLALSTLNVQLSTVLAQGTAFTYQGRLHDGATPACGSYDLTFTLYDAGADGDLIAGPLTNSSTAVSNGLFTVMLDFGAGVFTGGSNWLEIAVQTNGGSGFTTLAPRQQVTPTPYAIFANTASNVLGTVPSAGLAGNYDSAVTLDNPGNSISGTFTGDGTSVANVDAVTLDGLTSAAFWSTAGNAGANPTNGAFLGTTDDLPLELHVNGSRALRLENNFDFIFELSYGVAPNVIGGNLGNVVSNGFYGAFIAGGSTHYSNRVGGDFASVIGGLNNTASGFASTAAGSGNTASGNYSTALGDNDIAFGTSSTAMGSGTIAEGPGCTTMGESTAATGIAATAMGYLTSAYGNYSLAAGYCSAVLNNGSFVWADSSSTTPFSDSAPNQFLIRASGGVGIGTSQAPPGGLRVASGGLAVTGASSPNYGTAQGVFLEQGTGFVGIFPTDIGLVYAYDYAHGQPLPLVLNSPGGNVGIGTTSPGFLLQVGVNGAYCNGTTWVSVSDRNAKEDIAVINPRKVLEKVSALPITEWKYKVEADGAEHIGPMAQDFHAAFGLNGADDKHISTVDEGGVALAAIQGLNQKVEAQQAELKQKETEVTELKQRLAALEKIVLSQKSN